MFDNVFDIKKIAEESSEINPELRSESWLNEESISILLSALEDPSQKAVFERYVSDMHSLSSQLHDITSEFNRTMKAIIDKEKAKTKS